MIRESRYYLLASFISIAINFLTLPFFTRYLAPSDYGILGLFLIFGSVITTLCAFGLNTATYGLYFKYEIKKFRVLNTTIFIFLASFFFMIGFLVIFPFSDSISKSLFNSELSSQIIRLSYLNGCLNYFYMFLGQLLIAQKKSRVFSILSITHILLNALTSFYLLYSESFLVYDNLYMALVIGALVSNSLVLTTSLFINRNLFVLRISLKKIKRAIVFGIPEVPNVIISLLYSGFDKVMLVNYKGATEVGYYDFGNRFAGILKIFIDAIGKSFSPYFLEKISSNEKNSKKKIVSTFYELISILGIVALIISLFSEEALIVLTNENFYMAKVLVPFLILYYLFSILGQLSINQFIHAEKLYYLAPISILGLVSNVILNILLIPIYGVIGAVVATTISGTITSIIQLYYANKILPLPINIYRLIKLYLIILILLVFSYPLIISDFSIFLKIPLKISIIAIYIFMLFKMNYISKISLMGGLNNAYNRFFN